MHGDAARVSAWIAALKSTLESLPESIQTILCPPALWITQAVAETPITLAIGAQDCHASAHGPHTGSISAEMIASAGARYVILGHSERRAGCYEKCEDIAEKSLAAANAGLIPIICIGETKEQREAGETLNTLRAQIAGSVPYTSHVFIVAYEPVWAIGTGLTPSGEDIIAAHACIKQALHTHEQTRDRPPHVVYGGSVNAANASSILSLHGVDGALVGGASLDATQFASILTSASAVTHKT